MNDPVKKKSFWKRLPPLYKKRAIQAVTGYLIVLVALGAFIHLKGPSAVKEWEDRIPRISTPILPDTVEPAAPETSDVTPPDATAATTATPPIADTSLTAPLTPAVENAPVVVPAGARKAAYITIIITNAGLSENATNSAFGSLPADFAFAYSPYTDNLSAWLKKAAVAKRESLLLVPMEPNDFPKEDPGPKTLLTRLSAEENQENLNWILARADKGSIIGLMNDRGARLLADTKTLLPIFSTMVQKNLPFVEVPQDGVPQGLGAADMSGLSYLAADVKIDRDASSVQVIQQKLNDLEKIAMDRGYAIGVAEPYPVTISTLKTWSDSLDSRGIRLVPLTKVFKEMSRPADYETKKQ